MTPEAVQIVREMRDFQLVVANAPYLSNATTTEARQRAEALSSLLAVVEAIATADSFIEEGDYEPNGPDWWVCHCGERVKQHEHKPEDIAHRLGCLELIRQALSSVASETREG